MTDIEKTESILIYQKDTGDVLLEVRLQDETVWLSQAQLVALFGRDQSVISRHIRALFKEEELDRESNMQKMHIANSDRPVTFYSLDVIISVGYRVKSVQGTQFRVWANKVLKEYLLRGYALNEQRLKQHQAQLQKLEQTLTLFQQNIIDQASLPEAKGLVSVIT